MDNVVDIKDRLKSVQETAKITKAMELISVAKLNRINAFLAANEKYFDTVRKTIHDIVSHSDPENLSHPYLNKAYGDKTAYVVIASDRGLAGEYNHRILKKALEETENKEGKIYVVGETAVEEFQKRRIKTDTRFVDAGKKPTLDTARRITAYLLGDFESGIVNTVKFIYTAKSKISSAPVCIRVLPVLAEDFEMNDNDEKNYLVDFEPDVPTVFNILVPQYVLGMVYSALIQATASEHLERIRTMHQATTNANELIAKLNLEQNRIRQAAITTELQELANKK